ncbi:tyrosine-type recombinase/integrase [Capillimicrobium parvum]|uniref:Tyrosine recombinase XerC n=1 Tax=Capillimicrobium parvum TaxID=2884022 RepID=A0A9E6XXM6_9ACTN|nr:tyrosine-type recombinase/integrase [Capillimicrobium parvum]UGS35632.1 Tyrosine recombinase XerC [Capillimicrobium parvum]
MPAPANAGRKYPAEPLTPDEAQALIDAITGRGPLAVRNRALVALMWRSGLRVSEALALRPADVDERQGTVRVREGKGRKDRVAVIDSRGLGYVRAWTEVRRGLGLNGRQPLFCSVGAGAQRQAGQPLDPSYVRRLLPKLGTAAGIDKRVHPHGLRHTMATEMVERGLPLHVIAGQLGHSSTATTDTYLAKLMPSDRIKAMRAAGWDLDEQP